MLSETACPCNHTQIQLVATCTINDRNASWNNTAPTGVKSSNMSGFRIVTSIPHKMRQIRDTEYHGDCRHYFRDLSGVWYRTSMPPNARISNIFVTPRLVFQIPRNYLNWFQKLQKWNMYWNQGRCFPPKDI